jgi:uncharacterized membrane protein YhaH (DUF805 family)
MVWPVLPTPQTIQHELNGVVLAPWKKFATFSGRASRQEYWTFVLLNVVIYVALFILATQISFFGILAIIFLVAWILPTLAVGARRLHDVNHSGWWLLLSPVALIFSLMPGTSGQNNFG